MWKNGYWEGEDPKVSSLFGPDEEPACDCCESEGVELQAYRFEHTGSDSHYAVAQAENKPPFRALCEICANTHLGVNYQFPAQHGRDAILTQQLIAYATNLILKELRQNKR